MKNTPPFPMGINKMRLLVAVGIVVLFFSSCATETIIMPDTTSTTTTTIPTDVTQLFVEKGNATSDTVILYAVGGPQSQFAKTPPNDFDLFDFSRFREVYVHQTNTYNGNFIIHQLNKDLSFERAIREDSVSGEFLFQAVTYYNNLGKKVFILGHSFGSFVISLMLSLHPTAHTKIQKILIMAGRLDLPTIVWNGFKNRQPYGFAEDGITPIPYDINSLFPSLSNNEIYAITRLQAGIGQYRFTERLANNDLAKVVYAYSEKDKNVGRLSEDEVNFLSRKHAKIYYIAGGNHISMFDNPHRQNLTDSLFSVN